MLHTKFCENRPAGSGEEDFIRFIPNMDLDHLYKLSFPFPRRLHIKFGFDWPIGFRGEDV